MKISELAKRVKMPSKQLLIQVVKLGIPVKSIQGVMSDEEVGKVIAVLSKKNPSLNVEDIKKAQDAVKKKAKKVSGKTKPKAGENKAKAKPKKAAPEKKRSVRGVAKKEKPPIAAEAKEAEPKVEIQKPEAVPVPPEAKPVVKITEGPPKKTLQVKFPIIVKDLAAKMSTGVGFLIKSFMSKGVFATINQSVDEDDAKVIAEEFGYELVRLPTAEEETLALHETEEERSENLLPRAPVVTFMGHVDHGKTSLLDYIRKSKVADQEKGGITQHIGAYKVSLAKGNIAFLDTPGHEAFTAMRARGANATDIVVLVVAADDGLMPQTIEAIDHARAAEVPIVVAINKIDKANIDIDRTKKQLKEVDLLAEDWGGTTVTVNVSAKTGEGVNRLLEMILLEAEMLELKANPNKPARGIVIEGKLSKAEGPITTVLVKNGTLRQGDIIVIGEYYGKIRALIDDRIHRVKEALPSMPVEILGVNGTPHAGDTFMVVEDEKKAKEICGIRKQKIREELTAPTAHKITLEDLYSEMKKGSLKELKVILKADVRGSLEAIADSLVKLSTKDITLNVIHKGVGDVSESDILLAAASNAIVIGFHVRTTPEADKASRVEGVDLRLYNIIYEAVSDIKAAMEGLLEPHIKENFMGRVQIRQVFKLSRSGIIAGSFVQKGKINRQAKCRLIRAGEEIYKGKISSLKRFKDDVKEVAEGFECGISLENFKNVQAGDIIEAFSLEEIARKL